MSVVGNLVNPEGPQTGPPRLIGVVPAAVLDVQDGKTRARVEPHHDLIIKTEGLDFGAETTALLDVARAIRTSSGRGVVLLANGGKVARREALTFLEADWPLIILAGTGRQADRAARAVQPRWRWLRTTLQALNPRWFSSPAVWSKYRGRDIEVHRLADTPGLLRRRLLWRLSPDETLKHVLSTAAAYDEESKRAKRSTGFLQVLVLVLAILLLVLSLRLSHDPGRESGSLNWMERVLIALPIVVAIANGLSETLVPARRWISARRAAEAARRVIFFYRAGVGGRNRSSPAEALNRSLNQLDRRYSDADLSLAILPVVRGRPRNLSETVDEFQPLDVNAYKQLRLDDQIRYYRETGATLRRRLFLSVLATAILAASASVLVNDQEHMQWVGLLVFAAAAATVLQQRARWGGNNPLLRSDSHRVERDHP